MTEQRDWEQQKLREEYGSLYEQVLRLLFQYDPAGINFIGNTDEYAPEVGTILPRLQEAIDVKDLARILYEEFFYWFNGERIYSITSFEPLAIAVWKVYKVWDGN